MGTAETTAGRFRGVDPATGLDLEPCFICAAPAEVDAAAIAADRAFVGYSTTSGGEQRKFAFVSECTRPSKFRFPLSTAAARLRVWASLTVSCTWG